MHTKEKENKTYLSGLFSTVELKCLVNHVYLIQKKFEGGNEQDIR